MLDNLYSLIESTYLSNSNYGVDINSIESSLKLESLTNTLSTFILFPANTLDYLINWHLTMSVY